MPNHFSGWQSKGSRRSHVIVTARQVLDDRFVSYNSRPGRNHSLPAQTQHSGHYGVSRKATDATDAGEEEKEKKEIEIRPLGIHA